MYGIYERRSKNFASRYDKLKTFQNLYTNKTHVSPKHV